MTTDTKPIILYEDEELLVVEKPSGVLVHPDHRETEPTLVDWLLDRYPTIRSVGDSVERPGIVHRLDREASGTLVVAKTAMAFDTLKQQFQKHTMKKIYLVLVHGRVQREEGTIDFPISRSHRTGRMAARPTDESNAAKAITHFDVIGRHPRFTLLKVQTETGRTHQIRTHFLAYDHPVAGDTLYHGRQRDDCPRLFLHATTLGFTHPATGEWMEFSSPLPEDLREYLAKKKIPLNQ